MASGFKVADAYIEVHLDDSTAKRDVANLPNRIGADTDRAGTTVGKRMGQSVDKALTPEIDKSSKKNGDKLAQGMHLAIVRNSPLIAAGVGAALAAGAPAAIAGAGVLFAGIGIAAAAQNEVVKAAWGRTWSEILTGTQQDASVLQATVANMALQVSAAFEQMRPLMREAFSALAPIIESFTGSLLNAAQNALPGLVHAVQAAGPVFDGLGSLVEDIGTGLGKFFDIISEHSQAAGTAFAAIGDILGTLLPVLGDLLGAGAELASAVLPPLAAALRVVGDVLHFIAPILPEVAIGFAAFKAVQALSGPIDSFAGGLTKLVDGFKSLVSGPGSPVAAKSGLDSFKGALGPVGLALGLVGAAIVAASQQIDEWANALLAGGNAAEQATAQMQGIEDFFNNGATGIGSAVMGWTNWANALGVGSNASQTAKERAQELYDAMTPLQQANQDVTTAQNDLNSAIDEFGPHSLQANEALQRYNDATGEAERQQGALELAIDGVTQAMIDQANQALAGIDSQFAFEQSQINTRKAVQDLADVMADSKSTADDVAQAQLNVGTALEDQARKAAQAKADVSGLTEGTAEYTRFIQTETLNGLYQLRDAFPQFTPVINDMIGRIEASGVSLDELGARHPTPTVDLNQTPLQIGIDASNILLQHLGGQKPTPVAGLNLDPLNINWNNAMANIAILTGQRPTPVAGLSLNPFQAGFSAVMGNIATIAAQRPTPTVGVQDNASGILGSIKGAIDRITSKTVTITTNYVTTGAGTTGGGGTTKRLAAGGPVGDAIRAASGRVVGPGTGTSDSVPAIGPGGQRWALSNGEWIVRDAAVRALERAYGPGAMPTINSGRLPVATNSGSNGSMVKVQGGAVGHTYNVTVNVNGVAFADSSELPRRLVTVISDALRKRDRELS